MMYVAREIHCLKKKNNNEIFIFVYKFRNKLIGMHANKNKDSVHFEKKHSTVGRAELRAKKRRLGQTNFSHLRYFEESRPGEYVNKNF